MKKIFLLFTIFSLFRCNHKTPNVKLSQKKIDSTYFVYLHYYRKVTVDSLEGNTFLINRNSKYVKRLKLSEHHEITVSDSFLLDKKLDKLKNRILNLKLNELDTMYWDNKSEGDVRLLIFYNKNFKAIKRLRFIGNPEKKRDIMKSIDSFVNKVN